LKYLHAVRKKKRRALIIWYRLPKVKLAVLQYKTR
jgi:hypothetical protein